MSHTPGIWTVSALVEKRFDIFTGERKHDNVSCSIESESGYLAIVSAFDGKPYAANARLMAAAPELLEALEMKLESCSCNDEPLACAPCRLAILVIAKAKGTT